MKFSNKAYDILKWIAMLLLPALSVAIKQIFKIWMLPYGDQIGETISAINVLLSACLGISNIRYTAEQGIVQDGNCE